MGTHELDRHFADCELPVEFLQLDPRQSRFSRLRGVPDTLPGFIDVNPVRWLPKREQRFRIFVNPAAEMLILDKAPQTRHLLAMLRYVPENPKETIKQHFILGHDERQLFVVGVDPVSTLADAFTSLKPRSIRRMEQRGAKVIRQGDWFFTRVAGSTAFYEQNGIAYHGQQIGGPAANRRGLRVGTPHVADEQLVCIGDVFRWQDGQQRKIGREIKWILVRGKIRHPEHATVELLNWHFAVQNTGVINGTIGYLD